MKIIKPLDLGLLYRTYELNNRYYLVSTVLAFFSFENPDKLEMELQLWPLVAEELGTDGALDTGMPKVGGELLVSGNFYSPDQQEVSGGRVSVQVGKLQKELNVFGDRRWERTLSGHWQLSDPEMFKELALTYHSSFGGEDYPENPLGKGFVKDLSQYDSNTIDVPNITLPHQPFTGPENKIIPAGFGQYDLTWPQRFSKIGTYDEKWLNERFPGFAADFDPTFLNVAPQDQQQSEKFQCTESFRCENMHPAKPLIQSRLPGIRTRCFVNSGTDNAVDLTEINMKADTVWLFPHRERGVVLFRGQVEVADDQASEFSQMLLAYEALKDTPRNSAHYARALSKRLDKKKGHLQSFNEKDLIPEGVQSAMSQVMKMGEEAAGEGLLEKNLKKKSDAEIEAAWEGIREYGLDPDDYRKKNDGFSVDVDMDNLENLDEVVANIELMAKEQGEKLEKDSREMFADLGMDYDEVMAEAEKKKGARVQFSAEEMIVLLRESGINDPKKEARFFQIEKEFNKTCILYGHFFDAVPDPSPRAKDAMREKVIQAMAGGKSLANSELPGVDLSGLDLSGVNLSGSFLDGAQFKGTLLQNADLSTAMLARADLSDAVLTSANLTEVNLGKANVSHADFTGCLLEKAVFYQANMEKAVFKDAILTEADCTKCNGKEADFSDAKLGKAMFFESIFDGADFSGSDLGEVCFFKTQMQKANFSDAGLVEALFVEVNADGANFCNAKMENLRTAAETSMRYANFKQADLNNANVREVNFEKSDFTEANLSGADFTKAQLSQSTFYRAVAKQTSFMQADLRQAQMVSINLMEGSLQKAAMEGCDLRGANLFCADLMQVDFSTVLLDQANIQKTILSKWSSS